MNSRISNVPLNNELILEMSN